MLHLGDITKIHGDKVPRVTIITGGSPCQDLSVAGKRAGLAGQRSGLFMEQIRIIKEMRDESKRRNSGTNEPVRPRFMVWENVPGAFSSNGGEDFRAVLEETARVADERAVIPGPPNGRWTPAGCIMGDGWSIAWRVHDAQFWGVPQRRKRISLIADFGSATAPEILFERKGVSGHPAESREEGKDASTDVEGCAGKASMAISFQERAGKPGGKGILIQNERTGALSTLNNQSVCAFEPGAASRVGGHVYGGGVAGSLRANAGDNQQAVVYGISAYESNAMKSSNPNSGIYEAETARTLDLNGGSPAYNQGGMAVVQGADMYNGSLTGDIAATLNATSGDSPTHSGPSVVCLEGNGSRPSHQGNGYAESETMYTLNSTEHHVVCIENHPADSRVKVSEDGIVQTLSSRMGTGGGNVPLVAEPYTSSKNSYHQHFTNDGKAETLVAIDYKDPPTVCEGPEYIVRRLTPLECERIQGYPDHWTGIGEWIDSKGKKHKEADRPRYKALGNSIALPFWEWMAKRMVEKLKEEGVEEPTMASLFDGIGGFPLVFSRVGCEPVWASEIEEFPIAVTKRRFGEDESN